MSPWSGSLQQALRSSLALISKRLKKIKKIHKNTTGIDPQEFQSHPKSVWYKRSAQIDSNAHKGHLFSPVLLRRPNDRPDPGQLVYPPTRKSTHHQPRYPQPSGSKPRRHRHCER
jgi:hypothetical protein